MVSRPPGDGTRGQMCCDVIAKGLTTVDRELGGPAQVTP